MMKLTFACPEMVSRKLAMGTPLTLTVTLVSSGLPSAGRCAGASPARHTLASIPAAHAESTVDLIIFSPVSITVM